MSDTTDTEGARDRARQALEQVCARGDFAAAETVYSDRFIDHVNDKDFHGQEGIRQSVGLYRRAASRKVASSRTGRPPTTSASYASSVRGEPCFLVLAS